MRAFVPKLALALVVCVALIALAYLTALA